MNDDQARREEITRASQRVESFLQTLGPDDFARRSACEGWTVGDVVGHLIERGGPIPGQIERGLAGDISAPPGALDDPPLNEDQFRIDLDRRAVELRQELGDGLLGEFIRVNREFDRVLSLVQPNDWETLCYHRLRPETVRSKTDIRIAELAMHEWDIRWAFDPGASLAEDSLPGLVNASGRAVRRAFRPDPARTRAVRYRFDLSGSGAVSLDVALASEGVSIGHTFQDEVVIPSRLPKVSLKGLYQELSPEEYHRLHKLGLYYWAKDHGLCGGCGREPPRENRVLCERCAKQSGEIKKRSNAKRYQEALEQGLCTVCKNEPHRPNRRQCEACSDKNSKKQKIRRAKQKASRESSKTTESLQIHLALTGTQSD